MAAVCENGSPHGPQKESTAASEYAEDFAAIRANVLADVDGKLTAKVEELWTKGKQMMIQQQKKTAEKQDLLERNVKMLTDTTAKLEAENEGLKMSISRMLGQLAQVGIHLDTQRPGGAPGLEAMHTPNRSGTESSFGHVPPFPFPAEAAGVPAPPGIVDPSTRVSLADATTPPSSTASPQTQSTPKALSLAASLPVPPGQVTPSLQLPTSFTFTFTLRKADDTELGLNVSHSDQNKVLQVEKVRPEGAVESWNRLCGSNQPEKVVIAGDKIIKVNEVEYDPARMLEECKNKQLLKITVVRGELPAGQVDGASVAASTGTGLRAEATEFVPGGTSGITTPPSTQEIENPED